MKKTLLRYDSDKLPQVLKRYAKAHNQSINHTLNTILKHFFGLSSDTTTQTYSDLDSFFGSWSKQEEKDFKKTTDPFNKIDQELWKDTPQ